MVLNLEYFTAAGTAVNNGVFVPIGDLANGGLLPGELAAATTEYQKEGKFGYAFFDIVSRSTTTSPNILSDKLAISISKAPLAAATNTTNALDLLSRSYTVSWQVVGNSADNSFFLLPAPTIGSFATTSIVAFTDIFPNAVKIAAGGAVSGEGVLIPNTEVDRHGGPTYATLDLAADCRDYIAGIFNFIGGEIEIRDATIATAVTSVTQIQDTTFTLPDAAFDATNPTTGLLAADRNLYLACTRSRTITFEGIVVNGTSFDVNVATL
jgi:hypothetical protein